MEKTDVERRIDSIGNDDVGCCRISNHSRSWSKEESET
jgi:hypothetical protein